MRTETLCWNCKNSLGNCPWSEDYEPVEGWDATPTEFPTGYNADKTPRIIQSFCVRSCPQYTEDSRQVFQSDIAALVGKSRHYVARLVSRNFGKLQELVAVKGYKLRRYKTDSRYEYYIKRL